MKCLSALLLIIACVAPLGAQAQIKLEPISSGASQIIGYYSSQTLALSHEIPAGIKKKPALKSPLFGVIPAKSDGDRIFHVILDEPADSPFILYVDTNGDGDLTNDPATEWKESPPSNGFTTWRGGAVIALTSGNATLEARLGIYRFDKSDPSRSADKDSLFYYRDYGYRGQAEIGGKAYTVALSDEKASGDFSLSGTNILIDRNADGSFDKSWERFDIKAPFAIGGTTWELTDIQPLGGVFTIQKSKVSVAEIKEPPNHSVGKKITSFSMTDMDGKTVRFPEDYAGKIVMLDFWATWCGPCMQEVPGLASAYSKFKNSGFAVLGVTLDNPNQENQIRAVMREKAMTWREIYDGGGWSAKIATLYYIKSIPATFLVDGDTGIILAKNEELRGNQLIPTLEKALKNKGKR